MNKVFEILAQRGLSKKWLAGKIKMSQTMFTHHKNGNAPRMSTLLKILEALNDCPDPLTIDDIVDDTL